MEKNIQNRVDETMSSLDNTHRAEMPPFFQTRLMARVEKANELESNWLPVRKPVLVIAVLAVLLLMNTVLLTQQTEAPRTMLLKISRCKVLQVNINCLLHPPIINML